MAALPCAGNSSRNTPSFGFSMVSRNAGSNCDRVVVVGRDRLEIGGFVCAVTALVSNARTAMAKTRSIRHPPGIACYQTAAGDAESQFVLLSEHRRELPARLLKIAQVAFPFWKSCRRFFSLD